MKTKDFNGKNDFRKRISPAIVVVYRSAFLLYPAFHSKDEKNYKEIPLRENLEINIFGLFFRFMRTETLFRRRPSGEVSTLNFIASKHAAPQVTQQSL